ncbi:carboxylating nicotinate-nucleotide diphosphorylase [Aphanothece sacrum]|uniref:Probable nicotinate-nucleotide pyrophosphorylase [carboxylating] n=1 Tax=Aphanothece sacrum FPU1 TaxID=1920663 RepID=A0A401ICY9_APHSA|nr:carboxylating nicotinate-nucleotide diphosphorylase [Aphanothece sacrum]GBF79049.1 nicotinate-nucleotide pyrophosphorylase [Aphanothece sacrum FPU1]GBF86008.1 nicotinate-nucleotide pyrophosphorylase [Aphanothece sacrum FPU3]
MIPPLIILDPLLLDWLQEDIGRGDRTTQGLNLTQEGKGEWVAKETGVIAGLPIAARVFSLLSDRVIFTPLVLEGEKVQSKQVVAQMQGPLDALLMGERVALNLGMRLSGIATMTRQYTEIIADLPTKLVDTRKTTPGLRILEKYATQIGGAVNHRLGLDDAVMIKDNHIQAAGGIQPAIISIRQKMPYPLTIEVETSTLIEVEDGLKYGADIIMLDNMEVELMKEAVKIIRQQNERVKIEASGNITLENIRQVAETGVDYISSSAPITRSPWLDLSMRIKCY